MMFEYYTLTYEALLEAMRTTLDLRKPELYIRGFIKQCLYYAKFERHEKTRRPSGLQTETFLLK